MQNDRDQLAMKAIPAVESAPTLNRPLSRRRLWLLAAALTLIIAVAWRWGDNIWFLLRNEQALEQFLAELGWIGPVALIAFNALQIVVAPVPGYVVQIASGYLFGPFWGGVWASIGLLMGAMLSMWLVRQFGRPIAEWLIGVDRLARWETVTHSDSMWVWSILILGPIGDLPYFLAGLSQVKFSTIFLLTLLIRVPTTFVAAAIGAGAVELAWWQFSLLIVLLIAVLALFIRYQEALTNRLDQTVAHHLPGSDHPLE